VFTGVLAGQGIAISMDGKGAWRDNVFVERLWKSVKYEEVYLHAYESVAEARHSIGRYLDFYDGRRPHSRQHGRAATGAVGVFRRDRHVDMRQMLGKRAETAYGSGAVRSHFDSSGPDHCRRS
jgi:transposase InsO family protein